MQIDREFVESTRTSSGYVLEKNPSHPLANAKGMILQHRRVWFDAHGAIEEGHVIHHINEVRDDNRLENLASMSHADHMRHHYPNGFCSTPWNAGTAGVMTLVCSVCGIDFDRSAREAKRGLKDGRAIVCGAECRGHLRNPLKSGMGWVFRAKTGRYEAKCKGVYLGSYKTQSEAEAAYSAHRGAQGEQAC